MLLSYAKFYYCIIALISNVTAVFMYILQERVPIYPGAPVTKEESNLLIMSFIIRHNLSDVALEDLLELINCHIPRTVNVSKYTFVKQFPNIAYIKTFYYCPDCLILLNFGTARSVTCTSCRKLFFLNSVKRNGHFFLHIPLKDQLRTLFSGPLFNELQRDCRERDMLSDVTSGRVHKLLREKGILSNYDISLQWNADGVQAFKSSKVSMCPLQVSINELNYRLRKENVLLAGLWAATEKPVFNLFLQSFIDELKDLHNNGFQCLPPNFDEPITVKVHTILAPVDSVERCALQNIHQFNRRYGCSLCLNPGEHVPLGNGYTRVYRKGKGIKRTESQHRRDAIKSETENTVVNGVKGVSLLMLLPVFNIIRSFPPEYMHCVLLGVVKLFLSTWIDPKNCRKPWYIGTKSQIFDNRLSKILPPCEITRTPQSVSNISKWKASEFKNFLIYYSLPCLKDLLPSVFYKHWFLLVYAINVFDSDKIDTKAYENATNAITKFVSKTEMLYGMELMKFNVHLLLHIPKSIQDFGALWAWSAFPYESNNIVLRRMLHSSQTILQQICKSYLRLQTIKSIDIFSKAHCSIEGKTLYLKMLQNYKSRTGHRTIDDNSLIICGNGKIVPLSLVEKLSIQALIMENIHDYAISYERFIFNKVLYHSCTYGKLYKRNNSIIETTFGTFMTIMRIVYVTTLNRMEKYIIVGNSFDVLNDVLCTHNNISSSSFSHSVRETNNVTTCLPQTIRNKCILLPCNDKSYIMTLVNKMETD